MNDLLSVSCSITALDRARSLIALSRYRYVSVVSLMEQFERVKEQYSSAGYRVSAMASAPVASSLADLPAELANTLFSSALEAMDAVDILRGTTTALLNENYSHIDNADFSSNTDISNNSASDSLPDAKSQKTNSSVKGGGDTVKEIVKRQLKTVCDTYETARQLIVSEMEDCDRLVRLALSGLEAADEDEVLFSARGELVTASRSSLLRTEGTYFYGLLNRGSWLTDAIGAHPIDDDSAVLNLVIASLVDKPAFDVHVRELDDCARDYLTTRLDYYQVHVFLISDIRVHHTIEAVYENGINNRVTIVKINDDCDYSGAIWDPSVTRYTVTIDESIDMDIDVGFAPSGLFDVSNDNYYSCGWYLDLKDGCLYAQGGIEHYTSGCQVGDVISCIYDASSREISFERNGASLGVAYLNIVGEDIAPAVELYRIGDRITLSAC